MTIGKKIAFSNDSEHIVGGKRLKWIENVGRMQFIQTGIAPTDSMKFVMDYEESETNTRFFSVFFGLSVYDYGKDAICWRHFGNSNSFSPWFGQWIDEDGSDHHGMNGSQMSVFHQEPIPQIVHHVELSYGLCVYDEQRCLINSSHITTNSAHMVRLFGYNNYYNTSDTRDRQFKCHRFQVYDGNDMILNLVPSMRDDGTICMYDLVTKSFFLNSGTGNFDYSE